MRPCLLVVYACLPTKMAEINDISGFSHVIATQEYREYLENEGLTAMDRLSRSSQPERSIT